MMTMDQPGTTTPPLPPPIQQRTPRDVSTSVRWSLRLGSALGLVGWGMFGFGMIFFWLFAMNADVASLWQFDGETEQAPGQVTRSEKTKFTIGGNRKRGRPGKPVYANAYVFAAPDGTEHRGVSCATDASLIAGQAVEVEYPKGEPHVSRIVGMRRAPFDAWSALTALVPVVGLGLIVAGVRRGGRHADLLENGRLAWGKMVSKEATQARVNRKTVYKMTFEFTADNRRTYQVETRTHATEELEDEEHELILYQPGNPDVAVVADGLPAGVRIDEKGQVHQKRPLLVSLLLLAAALVGHGTYLCTTYLQ